MRLRLPSRLAVAVALAPLAVAVAACYPAPLPEPLPAPAPFFALAFLVSGPDRAEKTEEQHADILRAHLANINRLALEKKLLVAGPFGDPRPGSEVRGIFILDTADLETARRWTETDPAVQAGSLAMELCRFESPSPLRRVVELDEDARVAAAKEGRSPKMEDNIRGFVMLLAGDADGAERALASLRADGKVVFAGRLFGSSRGAFLAVLDAEDVAAAQELLAPLQVSLGPHQLSSWWTTRAAVGLATPAH